MVVAYFSVHPTNNQARLIKTIKNWDHGFEDMGLGVQISLPFWKVFYTTKVSFWLNVV
jgi:hypothetical protein